MVKSSDFRKNGEWILIKCKLPIKTNLEPLSVLYAKPSFEVDSHTYELPLLHDKEEISKSVKLQYARVLTTDGFINIAPHEYSIINISDYLKMVNIHYEMIVLMDDKQYSKKKNLNAQIFYMKTRGIGLEKALMLITNNINTSNVFYLKPFRETINIFF
jgi:hypothetical protein